MTDFRNVSIGDTDQAEYKLTMKTDKKKNNYKKKVRFLFPLKMFPPYLSFKSH